MDDHHKVDGD